MQFLAASSASLDDLQLIQLIFLDIYAHPGCRPLTNCPGAPIQIYPGVGRNPRRWFEAQPAGELKRSFPSCPSVSHTRYDYAEEDLSVRLMERRKEGGGYYVGQD